MGTDARLSALEAAVGLKLLSMDWVRRGPLHTVHRKQAYVQTQRTDQEMPKYPKKYHAKETSGVVSVSERGEGRQCERRGRRKRQKVYTPGTLKNVKFLYIRQQV